MSGIYPTTYYRVAVKALIKDTDGKLLLVKENSGSWDLPGGGLDHGEDPHDGLMREIHEEIGLTDGITIGAVRTVKTFFVQQKVWLAWIVYDVTISDNAEFQYGDGVTEIDYIDVATLQNSEDEREKYLSNLLG